jgi:hypothetical protein
VDHVEGGWVGGVLLSMCPWNQAGYTRGSGLDSGASRGSRPRSAVEMALKPKRCSAQGQRPFSIAVPGSRAMGDGDAALRSVQQTRFGVGAWLDGSWRGGNESLQPARGIGVSLGLKRSPSRLVFLGMGSNGGRREEERSDETPARGCCGEPRRITKRPTLENQCDKIVDLSC